MVTQSTVNQPLNEVQLMLLRLFSRPMPQQDMDMIRDLLLQYYETALQNELDHVIEQKSITRTDFEAILNKQQRTK